MLLRRSAYAGALATLVMLAACEDDSSDFVTPIRPVASIHLEPVTGEVHVGSTMQLGASPLDASSQPVSTTISWSSGDTTVATVSSSGEVAGLRPGAALIYATVGSVTGVAGVVVSSGDAAGHTIASVAVGPTEVSVAPGETVPVLLIARDSVGMVIPSLTPTWTSGNQAVATVSDEGVTGVAVGQTTITGSIGGVSATATVTVSNDPDPLTNPTNPTVPTTPSAPGTPGDTTTNPGNGPSNPGNPGAPGVPGVPTSPTNPAGPNPTSPGTGAVAGVTLSPTGASVSVGGSIQMAATTVNAAGETLAGRTVTWTSSNPATATVSASGVVTGVGAGTATITGTSEGVQGSTTVTVTAAPTTPPVASIDINAGAGSVCLGSKLQLTATPRDANGNALNARVVAWAITPSLLASISPSGLVTALGEGKVHVTATIEGITAGVDLNICPTPIVSLTINAPTTLLQVLGLVQLSVTARDANGNIITGLPVTWSASNSLVSVNASGLVQGLLAGNVVVTATVAGVQAQVALHIGL